MITIVSIDHLQMRRMRETPDSFHIIVEEPEMVNVCFWYIPERLRGQEQTKEWQQELGKVQSHLLLLCLLLQPLLAPGDRRAQVEDDVRRQPHDQLPAA